MYSGRFRRRTRKPLYFTNIIMYNQKVKTVIFGKQVFTPAFSMPNAKDCEAELQN